MALLKRLVLRKAVSYDVFSVQAVQRELGVLRFPLKGYFYLFFFAGVGREASGTPSTGNRLNNIFQYVIIEIFSVAFSVAFFFIHLLLLYNNKK